MGKNSKTKKGSNKFGLGQFVWNGFNLTVGVAFLGSLALLANSPKDGGEGLGLNIIWIFIVMALITGSCAFAFSKLARFHNNDNNGGAYIFARTAFGKMVGFLVAMLGYILIPLMLANQVLMFVKANLDPTMATPGGTE
jgi:amino acid transporter